jgi:hypothetical protein
MCHEKGPGRALHRVRVDVSEKIHGWRSRRQGFACHLPRICPEKVADGLPSALCLPVFLTFNLQNALPSISSHHGFKTYGKQADGSRGNYERLQHDIMWFTVLDFPLPRS